MGKNKQFPINKGKEKRVSKLHNRKIVFEYYSKLPNKEEKFGTKFGSLFQVDYYNFHLNSIKTLLLGT